MADKLIVQQLKFAREKAAQLTKELETRRQRGELKIQKLEAELRLDLENIQHQITTFTNKADILETIISSGKSQ
jgi:hypothetical protein